MSEVIEQLITERIKRLEDIKARVDGLSKQIEGLQSQQRALYNVGLETKGSIEVLIEAMDKEKARVKAELAKKQEEGARRDPLASDQKEGISGNIAPEVK